jgi:hypothetical protein
MVAGVLALLAVLPSIPESTAQQFATSPWFRSGTVIRPQAGVTQVQIPPGSAAAPGATFPTEATGPFLDAAGRLGISVVGTRRVALSDVLLQLFPSSGSGTQNMLLLNNGARVGFTAGGASASDADLTFDAAGVLKVTTGDGATLGTMSAQLRAASVTFASLGASVNGTVFYCSNCTIANPCAGAGTGALAKRLNGVWVCN